MKIAFVISSLGPGGAERVAATLCNAWAENGHKVTIITFDDAAVKPFYRVNPSVTIIGLGVLGASNGITDAIIRNVSAIRLIRQYIKKIDAECVVSFMDTTNIKTILATMGLAIPTIVAERIHPPRHPIPRAWGFLRKVTYPMAAVLVTQTSETKAIFSAGVQKKTMVIPNPLYINEDQVSPPTFQLSGHKKVVGMGRLAPQKRFDLLIKAFGRIEQKHGATLTILGEGPLRHELIALRDKLGLADIVNLPGVIKNPFPILKQADIFVLSSEYEGFPNVLLEAMGCGLAVISFDCPAGPKDIISDGVDGLLLPPLDFEGLASTMDRLLSDDIERKKLAQNALEVRNKYALNQIMEMWNRAIMIAVSKLGTSSSITGK